MQSPLSTIFLCVVTIANVAAFLPATYLGSRTLVEHRQAPFYSKRCVNQRPKRSDCFKLARNHDLLMKGTCRLSRGFLSAQLSNNQNPIGRRELLETITFLTAYSTLGLGAKVAAAEVTPRCH